MDEEVGKVDKKAMVLSAGGEDSDGDEKHTIQYMLNSPAYMSAIMRRQLLQEMVKTLPKVAQDRVAALKNIQLQHLEIEANFFEEVYQLEKKYHEIYKPLQEKRKRIICGDYEPTDVEKEFKGESDEDLSAKMQEVSLEIRKNLKQQYPDDVKGIPDFWLTIFRSNELLSTMVQEQDEPVLKKLVDIQIIYADDLMAYTIQFHFEPNEHFTNRVLTKQYFLKSKVDPEHPFLFEGPEIFKCTGCIIHWNKGMNLTVKTIRKKQKHKSRGAVRTITKQVPADSFFNFFNPPQGEDEEKLDVDIQNILGTDFEIGHFLRARIIPKAVLYYTGDVVDDDDDDYDEEEEEEEEDYEEEDSDEEEGGGGGGGGGGHAEGGNKGGKKKAGNPAECQQQ